MTSCVPILSVLYLCCLIIFVFPIVFIYLLNVDQFKNETECYDMLIYIYCIHKYITVYYFRNL